MLDHMEQMFSTMPEMLKRLKKDTYERNMKEFRNRHGHYFLEIVQYVEESPDQQAAARELGEHFASTIWNTYQKRGKMAGRTQADLDFFMIYYVFPALLMTEHECAHVAADELCAAWRRQFKGSNISYTTYEDLLGGFRNKILGIF